VPHVNSGYFACPLVYRVLVRKPERTRHRWDNIKIDLQEEGCGGMDWIDLTQDRDKCQALVKMVMYLWVPQNAGNFLTS
jgi:hypothetical protein